MTSCKFECIDILLEVKILLEGHIAVSDGLLRPFLKKLGVAPFLVSCFVKPSWFDTEGPRTFNPSLFLVTVVVGPVVNSDRLEVGLTAVLL